MHARKSQLQNAMRSALYTTATIPAVALIAPNVMAQELDATLEEIVVTGSRIARDPNVGANVPVQSLSGEKIQLAGEVDLGEVLNDMPSLLGSNTSSNSLSGIFGSGEGENAGASEVGETILQLRGLGIERTLVLVNGRRHVAGVSGSQAVDVGSIPQQLVERVDVLTGGASAIYGADAVTGVVNFILKENYEGLNFNVTAGISGDGDAENLNASALWGTNFAGDRGNIAIAVDYTTREPLFMRDRSWSNNNGVGSDDPHPDLRYQTGEINATDTPNFARFYSPSTAFASTDPPCDRFDNLYDYCFGFAPTGMPILTGPEFTNLWQQAFPGDPDPVFTAAELALFDRAANSPNRAILPQHVFSLTSVGGVLVPGGLFDPGIDVDNNGVSDCQQSYQGFISTYDFSPPLLGNIGGCWIIEPDGSVRPIQDGLVSSEANQWGEDGIPDHHNAAMLIPDDWAANINLIGHYDVTDSMSFFWEAKYSRKETLVTDPQGSFWDLLTIAPDNPYISQLPAALAAVGQSEGLFITRDPIDQGPNHDLGTRSTTRIVVGLEGEWDNGWGYEFSANFGKGRLKFEDGNRVIVDRWFAAIDAVDDGSGNIVCRSTFDPDLPPPPTTPFQLPTYQPSFHTFNPGDGSCQPANILGGVGGISQESIDFFTTTTFNSYETEQMVFSGIVTGEWGETNAGPIGFAAGVELRAERATSVFDPLVRGVQPVDTDFGEEGQLLSEIYEGVDDTQRSLVFDSTAEIRNIDGSYDVGDVFGEVSVPLLTGRSFAEDLTFDGAVRFSNYSTVGSTLTWKAGGSWTPVSESFRLRGSYSVAVRAPNINELFSPAQAAFFRPDDPCDVDQVQALLAVGDARGPIRQANCAAEGIPANFTDPLTARFVGQVSGNPDLTEEEAETFSVGFIFQPENFLAGLTVTADYWDITIDDAIDTPDDQDIVDGCYDSIEFPDNQFCSLIRRQTDMSSPQFRGLDFIAQQQVNIGKLEASGVDFAIQYMFDIGASNLRLGVAGTWMEKLNRFFDPSNPAAVDPELGELQRPELAGNFTAEWATGPFQVAYQMQYMDEQGLREVEIETAAINYGPAGIADSVTIHDISASWDITDRYRVYGGVNNFTDEQPFLTEFAFPVTPVGTFFFLGLDVNIN